MNITLTVNGRHVSAEIEDRTSLADFLRSPDLGCTSVHLGCEHGVCGACTVIIDGRIQRSCIALAAACEGSQVVTLEGLGDDEIASELKESFRLNHGLQCGFCTPAMIISAREIIALDPDLDEEALRFGMSGNLCRCTGFAGIVKAIKEVADRRAARLEISG